MQPVFLFDLDGTLTDPAVGITKSVCHALAHFGITVPDRKVLLPFIGPPLRDSFCKYYGFTPAQAEEAVAVYREYFSVTGLFENEPYPGIHALLEKLVHMGCLLAVATSKPTVFSVQILEKFDLAPYFSGIYGSELDGSRDDKAAVIGYALEQLGRSSGAKNVVMIGDRSFDVVGAKKNGLACVGVAYGYGTAQELTQSGACAVARDIPELDRILEQFVRDTENHA